MTKDNAPYVINKMANKTAEILIYEPIGSSFWEEGLTAKRFAEDLKSIGDVRRIDIRINSVGGSVFDGLAIYNALANHSATIVAHIDGVALSMASVIAMAAGTVEMAENGLMMVHNPRGSAIGEAKDLRKVVEALDKSRESILQAYVSKTGRDREELGALMDAETWLSAAEAKELGFVDDVVAPINLAASFDLNAEASVFDLSVPPALLDRFQSVRNKESKKMSSAQPATQVQPQPATLAELIALGADSEFIVAQLSENATLQAATAAWMAKLQADLLAAKKDAEEAKAALAKQPVAQQNVEPVVLTVPAEGIPAMSNNATPGNATPPPPKVVDHGEVFDREFKKNREAGMSAQAAMNKVYADFPLLKQEILAEAGRA